ncbi:hypothetical protein [Salinivibrio proteolyticus]|uniref:HK97 gp10 family phage protein n=1 Tax=Salinivibrio proteolyticus TaxID=334715 RepID=A0ABY7LB62_9GAMM|nr:hypothetical protein [Salinivibrio proteolyticus]WBA13857.1 hypothetical protein N7E60_08955 [Salinivibrio proteolyticus]
MQLDEYIKETLVQIAKGVRNAAEEVKSYGGRVNPAQEKNEYGVGGYDNNLTVRAIEERPERQMVKFDIGLKVSEKSGKGAGAKASVSVLSFSGGVNSSDEAHSAHRVQFDIPIDLPSQFSE